MVEQDRFYFIRIVRCLFIFVSINEIYEVNRSSILYPSEVSHNSFEPLTKFPIVI